MGLDLYAKIEGIMPFYQELQKLYHLYLSHLRPEDKVLDLGCGTGRFMELAINQGISKIKGLDLSRAMVAEASKKNLDVICQDITEVKEQFDCIVAIFDVINYIPRQELKNFFTAVYSCLNDEGVFYADINTYYGFNDIATGVVCFERGDITACFESDFANGVLTNNFVVFEQTANGLYEKSTDSNLQYFYSLDEIKAATHFKSIKHTALYLYEEEQADKYFLQFTKSSI